MIWGPTIGGKLRDSNKGLDVPREECRQTVPFRLGSSSWLVTCDLGSPLPHTVRSIAAQGWHCAHSRWGWSTCRLHYVCESTKNKTGQWSSGLGWPRRPWPGKTRPQLSGSKTMLWSFHSAGYLVSMQLEFISPFLCSINKAFYLNVKTS